MSGEHLSLSSDPAWEGVVGARQRMVRRHSQRARDRILLRLSFPGSVGCDGQKLTSDAWSLRVHRCAMPRNMKMPSQFRVPLVVLCATFILGGASFTVGAVAAEHVRSPPIAPPSDCNSVGLALAEQKGGTLARVSQSQKGTKSFCVIVLLETGKEGARPRRVEYQVPISNIASPETKNPPLLGGE